MASKRNPSGKDPVESVILAGQRALDETRFEDAVTEFRSALRVGTRSAEEEALVRCRLSEALGLRRTQEGQSPQGREVSFRLAELKRTRLDDPNGALQLYQSILAADIRRIYEQDMHQPSLAFMAAVKSFSQGLDREGQQPELERLRPWRQAHAKAPRSPPGSVAPRCRTGPWR